MNTLKHDVTFDINGISLEGILHSLETTQPTPGIVVCHPHPLYGGDMRNLVVASVCRELNNRGEIALRFNFRGVGTSQGSYGEGEKEIDDALGAVSFLTALPNVDSARIGIVGYSFGAYVALRAAVADERIAAVAAISPPAGMWDLKFFQDYPRPKMLVSGALDDLVDVNDFTAFAEKVAEPKVLEIAPHADHFWVGLDGWLAGKIADFFTGVFASRA